MEDTIPMPLEAMRAAHRPAVSAPVPLSTTRYPLEIAFSGSGSEYFRIWIVNLLLTLVTLGLYYPWAKVRRLRYFYGNTSVGGHALDFHGDPKRMLRGFLLVGAMVLLYSVAGQVSPTAGLIAFLIVAALWPALFRASLQFRLANTSWRGLRFRFDGDQRGAYMAMLPLFVPGAVSLLGVLLAGNSPRAGDRLAGLAALTVFALFPLFFWRLKKYQHDHYALGQARTELDAGVGSFYGLALKTVGVFFVIVLLAGAVAAVVGGFSAMALVFGGRGGRMSAAAIIAMTLVFFAAYAAIILVIYPYVTSRLQNLVWGRTRSDWVEFGSRLEFWPLLRLTLKNWLLVLITLGLYLPFAKVATARLRLEAMSVATLLPPDELVDQLRERADDAAGDAAGDLFGIDIGL
jgi:uncharacterized membrane protein YjgN (DUF898 family)